MVRCWYSIRCDSISLRIVFQFQSDCSWTMAGMYTYIYIYMSGRSAIIVLFLNAYHLNKHLLKLPHLTYAQF